MDRRSLIMRFRADERGATAVEYGLICGMIAVVVVGIAAAGGGLGVTWNKLVAVVTALGGGS